MERKQRFVVVGDIVNVANRVLARDLIQIFFIRDELAQVINYDFPSKEIPDYLYVVKMSH